MNTIAELIGYDNYSIADYYDIFPYYDEDNIHKPEDLMINVKLKGSLSDNIHYIDVDKSSEIMEEHRRSSIDGILEDINVKEKKIFEYKIGDVIFFDFRIHYVQEMRNDIIIGVNDGFGGTSGWELNKRCFKLNPHTIRMSDHVMHWYHRISRIYDDFDFDNDYILNMADVNHILSDLWVDLISDESKSLYELNKFSKSVINSMENKNYDLEYEGEKLYRKRIDNH